MRLQGGLGNQLFQYAAGRGISERLGLPLLLDLSWYRNLPKGATLRNYELARYPIKAVILDPGDVHSPWFWSMERVGCIVRMDGRFILARSFRERGFDYDSEVCKLRGARFLEGYWQSPLYFESIADALRAELRPSAPMGEEDAHIARLINADVASAVAVHVRRGDYLTGVHAQHHGTCGLDYYRRAFEKLRSVLKEPRFFVFSDDPQWVAQQRDVFGDAVVVAHNSPDDAIHDHRLMSLCRAHVIANSSFSWWAAWISNVAGKLVIAPVSWLANGVSMPSLIPSDWLRL